MPAGPAASTPTARPPREGTVAASSESATPAGDRACVSCFDGDGNALVGAGNESGRQVSLQARPGTLWGGLSQPAAQVRLKPDPTRRGSGSLFTCEQRRRTGPGYAGAEEPDHECQPSTYGHTSAAASDEEAEQAAGADRRGARRRRTGRPGNENAAHLLGGPPGDQSGPGAGGRITRTTSSA